MRVQLQLHGWLRAPADRRTDPLAPGSMTAAGGWVELELPEGSDVAQAIAALREVGALPERRGWVVTVDGRRAALDRRLSEGEKVHLFPLTSGG